MQRRWYVWLILRCVRSPILTQACFSISNAHVSHVCSYYLDLESLILINELDLDIVKMHHIPAMKFLGWGSQKLRARPGQTDEQTDAIERSTIPAFACDKDDDDSWRSWRRWVTTSSAFLFDQLWLIDYDTHVIIPRPTVEYSLCNAVVTCIIKLSQNNFSLRRRPSEVILFAPGTCLKLFQNYIGGLLQLMNISQRVRCRWNNF